LKLIILALFVSGILAAPQLLPNDPPPEFTKGVDLLSNRVGGKVISFSDQFFAEAENLLKPEKPVFVPKTYNERGQVMDGWETRRHNPNEFDWVILKLGLPGTIHGVMIDTAYFTGNHGPQATLEAIEMYTDSAEELEKSTKWEEILPKVDLRPGFENQSQHYFAVDYNQVHNTEKKWTHLRFKQYPDGGIARLKVYGKVLPDWNSFNQDQELDLAYIANGGVVVAVSDMYFSSKDNIIMPGRGVNMGDGWETKRSRVKGHVDWLIIKLGKPARRINRLEIDTAHYKGNFPESCIVEGANVPEGVDLSKGGNDKIKWRTILGRTKLTAHTQHYFDISTTEAGETFDDRITHVKLTIIPDGGVSRFRVNGLIVRD